MRDVDRAFRENVTRLREERGWSRAELSRRAGLSDTTVAQVEAGRCSVRLHTGAALADALGSGLDDMTTPREKPTRAGKTGPKNLGGPRPHE